MKIPNGYILIKESDYQSLLKRLEELESRVKKNSHNSSKPPSSDGLKKSVKNNREKSNRSPGAQQGHKGSGLSPSPQVDATVKCKVEHRCDCGKDLRLLNPIREEKRQVIDIAEILTHVIEYLVEVKKCSCGKEYKGACAYDRRVQYGKKLKSLCTYLSMYQMLPAERIQELVETIFGLSISDGTIQSSAIKCYTHLEQTQEQIKQSLLNSEVIHNDETGIRCLSLTQWVHSVSNQRVTLYGLHPKRGNEGIDAMGIMLNYSGVSVHDRWASYDKYRQCTHALCNAHLLRDLRFLHEDLNKKWAGKLISLLKKANQRKKEEKLTNHFRTRIRNQIMGLVHKALRNEPREKYTKIKRGRKPQSKAIRLLEVFKNRLDDILLFLQRPDVPFDNNLAERDLRMIKLKQKISGCFRTKTGADIFCRIRSYISTAKKQGHNIWDAITQAIEGNPVNFTFSN